MGENTRGAHDLQSWGGRAFSWYGTSQLGQLSLASLRGR